MTRKTDRRPRFSQDRIADAFISTSLESLSYLISDYGFEMESILLTPMQKIVRYAGSEAMVETELELGQFLPTVFLSRITGTPGRRVGMKVLPVDYFIDARSPKLRLPFADSFSEPNEQIVRETIEHYARAIPVCAADVLKGDFELFDDLRRRKRGPLKRGHSTAKIPS